MKQSPLLLISKIRDVLRNKALEIPKFKETGNGAIRILCYPEAKEADAWLGGLSDYSDPDAGVNDYDDITDYEWCFTISPTGSRVIKFDYDGVAQTCDCYGYSALKIAHCCKAQTFGLGLTSGINLEPDPNNPIYTEDNGYAPYHGAIVIEINKNVADIITPFLLIYVCISGASSEEDEKVVMEAIPVIKKYFETEDDDFIFNTP